MWVPSLLCLLSNILLLIKLKKSVQEWIIEALFIVFVKTKSILDTGFCIPAQACSGRIELDSLEIGLLCAHSSSFEHWWSDRRILAKCSENAQSTLRHWYFIIAQCKGLVVPLSSSICLYVTWNYGNNKLLLIEYIPLIYQMLNFLINKKSNARTKKRCWRKIGHRNFNYKSFHHLVNSECQCPIRFFIFLLFHMTHWNTGW